MPKMPKRRGHRGELTDRQFRFVEGVLRHGDRKRAYVEAGFSAKGNITAKVSRLLGFPAVQEAMRSRREQVRDVVRKETDVEVVRVVRELSAIAFTNMQDVASWGGGKGVVFVDSETVAKEHHPAVRKVKSRIRTITSEDREEIVVEEELELHSKPQALQLIGQHLGMFQREKGQGALHVHLHEAANPFGPEKPKKQQPQVQH